MAETNPYGKSGVGQWFEGGRIPQIDGKRTPAFWQT